MNRFVWMRNGVATVVSDIMTVYVREDFDPEKDTFFRIGSQVKVSLKIDDVSTRR